MPHSEALEIGLRSLRWLVSIQQTQTGCFRPIGSNGFYERDGARADFDQQPLEAQAMVSACHEAFRATEARHGRARRNEPSSGSWAATIWASRSTTSALAAAVMGFTRIA